MITTNLIGTYPIIQIPHKMAMAPPTTTASSTGMEMK